MSTKNLTLRSTVRAPSGQKPYLELSFVEQEIPKPKPTEVVIRLEAAPINPSDLYLLLTGAELATGKSETDSTGHPNFRAEISEKILPAVKGRIGQQLPVGNEGAGTVVAAGSDPAAQKLIGKVVAAIGGGMYANYRVVDVSQVIEHLPGTTAKEAASSFVNPLTVLGMIETMKNHKAKGLIHTAAASQLGQQLVRVCKADGIPLINIVRRNEQEELLKQTGAKYVINTSKSTWNNDLVDAIYETGIYLAFDATGGGVLASQILTAMEQAALRNSKTYSRYGSDVHKHVYIYGGLDTSPITLHKAYGLSWGVQGWLLFNYLASINAERNKAVRERVAKEIKTNFITNYTAEISLTDFTNGPLLQKIAKMSTSEKYLVLPQKGKQEKQSKL